VRQHLRRNVPGNLPDDAVVGLRLGKLRNRVMPQIVKSKTVEWRPNAAYYRPCIPHSGMSLRAAVAGRKPGTELPASDYAMTSANRSSVW